MDVVGGFLFNALAKPADSNTNEMARRSLFMTTSCMPVCLIDLGRATKRTRGNRSGPFFEGGTAPYVWWGT